MCLFNSFTVAVLSGPNITRAIKRSAAVRRGSIAGAKLRIDDAKTSGRSLQKCENEMYAGWGCKLVRMPNSVKDDASINQKNRWSFMF